MSRKIKFRAWVNDHWTDFIPVAKTLGIYNESVIDIDGYTYEKDNPFIVEQYTGLKDKNGKEIYEGDIVEEAQGRRNVVTFDTEDIGSCGCCVPEFWGSGFRVSISSSPDRCEVIGNIHENPELLRRKKMDD